MTSGGDLSRFTKLPWTIYAGDPQWVPPLLTEVREFVNRKRHPFYLYGNATMFLALRSGRPAGRILVSDDPHYNEFHHENLGFFGKFESTNDRAVAHALLDAAGGWLRETRAGRYPRSDQLLHELSLRTAYRWF